MNFQVGDLIQSTKAYLGLPIGEVGIIITKHTDHKYPNIQWNYIYWQTQQRFSFLTDTEMKKVVYK